MPGKNSNFDETKRPTLERICCIRAYLWIILVIILVEVYGMFRFYFAWRSRTYSTECFILCLFWVVCDIQIIKALHTTHISDPGYILPGEQMVT